MGFAFPYGQKGEIDELCNYSPLELVIKHAPAGCRVSTCGVRNLS